MALVSLVVEAEGEIVVFDAEMGQACKYVKVPVSVKDGGSFVVDLFAAEYETDEGPPLRLWRRAVNG